MLPEHIKLKVKELRDLGNTYQEIMDETGISSKGTLSHILKNHPKTEALLKRTKEIKRLQGKALNSQVTKEERIRRGVKGGKACSKKHATWKENFKDGRHLGSLAYLEEELQVKVALEKEFKTTFKKEKINGRYFDFVDDRMIIEHSYDHTKGVSDIIKRFSKIPANEKRIKIAYIATRSGRRKEKLIGMGVKVFHVSNLEK